MAVVTVPRPLREKLGDDGADSLVSLLNQVSDSTRVDVTALVEEKFERRLTDEISKMRVDLMGEISKVRVDLMGEISKVRVEMAETKADLIRWMFLFWVGQLVAMAGLLFAFFRK